MRRGRKARALPHCLKAETRQGQRSWTGTRKAQAGATCRRPKIMFPKGSPFGGVQGQRPWPCFPSEMNDERRPDPAWPPGAGAREPRGGGAGARAGAAPGPALRGAVHGAGVHLAVPDHRAAGFRAHRDRLRARRVAGGEQVAEAVPDQLPQPRRVPRGVHDGHRDPAGGAAVAGVAADRGVLVSARRHPDRRVLADRGAAGGVLGAGAGRARVPRAGVNCGTEKER